MRATSALLLVAGIGCSTTAELPLPPGYRCVLAQDVRVEDGLLTNGVLEYRGAGDLGVDFHSFLLALHRRGWYQSQSGRSVSRDGATLGGAATLFKEGRSLRLSFRNVGDDVGVVLAIGPWAPQIAMPDVPGEPDGP